MVPALEDKLPATRAAVEEDSACPARDLRVVSVGPLASQESRPPDLETEVASWTATVLHAGTASRSSDVHFPLLPLARQGLNLRPWRSLGIDRQAEPQSEKFNKHKKLRLRLFEPTVPGHSHSGYPMFPLRILAYARGLCQYRCCK